MHNKYENNKLMIIAILVMFFLQGATVNPGWGTDMTRSMCGVLAMFVSVGVGVFIGEGSITNK